MEIVLEKYYLLPLCWNFVDRPPLLALWGARPSTAGIGVKFQHQFRIVVVWLAVL